MVHVAKEGADHGKRISLDIPAQDPDLFKNKATDDVLVFLSRHRFDEFTIGELAGGTGHTKPTVGRAVDVLAENKLVRADNEANRRLVRINRDRFSVPDDPFLRIPQSEFQKPVRAAVEELENALEDLLGIVLFGSVAEGQADRRSDVDLWVLVREHRAESQRRANDVAFDLGEREFGNARYDFDIDVESVSSVPRYTESVRDLVHTGIPLHETPEFEKVERLLLDEEGDDA